MRRICVYIKTARKEIRKLERIEARYGKKV